MYNNIYDAPHPEQPPLSNADKASITMEKSAFNSYINDVVINDIQGEGCEGIKTLLLANDTLEKERKTDQC